MLIYSQKIIRFINESIHFAKKCLSKEIGFKIYRERFYDNQNTSYPINIVVFNDRKLLGYFDPLFYEIGLHECLMHANRDQLHNVIRHELAHYISFINYGGNILPHGPEFKAFCRRMHWDEKVFKATTCIDDGANIMASEESSILRKVQKLMALSTSGNINESEQAMIKANELLLKHNIDSTYATENSEDKILLKRIMCRKKANAKLHAIAKILKTFFVNIVYRSISNGIYLEITGNAVNIEIAEYVAHILEDELERLWNHAKRQHAHLKGLVAKNSFFTGIAIGYCNKMNALKKSYSSDMIGSLMVIENTLAKTSAMIYPRLSQNRSSRQHCETSSALGKQAGQGLNINPAINKSSASSHACLVYAE